MSDGADEDLTLIAGGQAVSGWQAIRVTRGAERMPSDFDIALTELYPGQAAEIVIKPGDPCTVQLGDDLAMTGYVDRYMPAIGPRQHSVRIMGRSKCLDLVDNSAITHGMQISGASILALAQQLAQPYGITVSTIGNPQMPVIPQFNVTLAETPFEIIERVARYSQLLVYDDRDGNLLLSTVGAQQMASGFQLGVNVQAASATFSIDERYNAYIPAIMSVDSLSDLGSGNTPFPTVYDKAVRAPRQLVVVSEQFQYGVSLAQQRAEWEATRRYGRSQAVRIVCDSWRDSSGALWAPNAYAEIDLPPLKIVNKLWIISEVAFFRDEQGTHADLVLMPKEAFQPEPSVLQLYDWQIGQELAANGAAPNFARRDE